MVGATGFEPATSCSRSKRSTKLSYAPIGLLTHPQDGKPGQALQRFFERGIGKSTQRRDR